MYKLLKQYFQLFLQSNVLEHSPTASRFPSWFFNTSHCVQPFLTDIYINTCKQFMNACACPTERMLTFHVQLSGILFHKTNMICLILDLCPLGISGETPETWKIIVILNLNINNGVCKSAQINVQIELLAWILMWETLIMFCLPWF